jgi:hypothetical protein
MRSKKSRESAAFGGPRKNWKKASVALAAGLGVSTASVQGADHRPGLARGNRPSVRAGTCDVLPVTLSRGALELLEFVPGAAQIAQFLRALQRVELAPGHAPEGLRDASAAFVLYARETLLREPSAGYVRVVLRRDVLGAVPTSFSF